MIKLEDVLLTDEEKRDLLAKLKCNGVFLSAYAGDKTWEKAENKAQCLKLLDVLKKQWLLRCDYRIQDGKRKCYRKTCRRCQLEKLLKEG